MKARNSFQFKVGQFECQVISDGKSIMPKQLLGLNDMQPHKIDVMCLIIKTARHLVLVDTGWGDGREPGAGKLIQNLGEAGIKCEDIDLVILSHGHPDHIGGNTNANGRAVFPKARYIMNEKEWKYWTSNPEQIQMDESIKGTILAAARKNLIPIQDQFDLVDITKEIEPGINLISAPGHTPGHVVVQISQGNNVLLCTCDLFRNPLELSRPDLYIDSDIISQQINHTKRQILSEVIKSGMLIFACHFPFPGLGYIGPQGEAWIWKPIVGRDRT